MTTDEAKDYIREWCPYGKQDEIIKALSNSDEDCISRAEAIEINKKYHGQMPNDINHQICQELNNLPSVQPKPKTGHWEWVQYDSNPEIGNFHCSECNFMPASFNWASKHLNYCPNCGAKMESKKTYCTECPYFTNVYEGEQWFGARCKKDGHSTISSMYAIKLLHNDCPLTAESEDKE